MLNFSLNYQLFPKSQTAENVPLIRQYIMMVDELTKDVDGTKALLGLIQLQSRLDKRLNDLFGAELVCPEEVRIIKEKIM